MNKIEIKVDAFGRGTIIVDDKDISSNVKGFNLKVRAGKMTTIFVSMTADVNAIAEVDEVHEL